MPLVAVHSVTSRRSASSSPRSSSAGQLEGEAVNLRVNRQGQLPQLLDSLRHAG
jgi:hypothetical protein